MIRIPIALNPKMPRNEIRFVDRQGRVVGSIVNVELPPQEELEPEAARILVENLWDLYE